MPWKYNNPKSNDPNMGGKLYPVMSNNELKRLPISDIASANSVIFSWVTMPKIPDCLDIVSSWGFNYITTPFVWVKTNRISDTIYSGLGHWTNQNAEMVLLFKRGHPKRIRKNVKQIVMYPVGKHSAKPPIVRDRIVELMGDIPRIELFARPPVPDDWLALGNEIDGLDIFDSIGKYID